MCLTSRSHLKNGFDVECICKCHAERSEAFTTLKPRRFTMHDCHGFFTPLRSVQNDIFWSFLGSF